MARIKNNSHFVITNKEELKKLVLRIQRDAKGEAEYTNNEFPSEEEKHNLNLPKGGNYVRPILQCS